MAYNSTIKPKMGVCPECGDGKDKPLISGKCQSHYWAGKRKPLPKATKPIRPRSKKRERQESKYRAAREKYFEQHPVCEFPGCKSTDVTLHHMRGRIGSLLHDKRYFKSLCWHHHQYVEQNPHEAKQLGLSLNRIS